MKILSLGVRWMWWWEKFYSDMVRHQFLRSNELFRSSKRLAYGSFILSDILLRRQSSQLELEAINLIGIQSFCNVKNFMLRLQLLVNCSSLQILVACKLHFKNSVRKSTIGTSSVDLLKWEFKLIYWQFQTTKTWFGLLWIVVNKKVS